jgi:hypothetical protein
LDGGGGGGFSPDDPDAYYTKTQTNATFDKITSVNTKIATALAAVDATYIKPADVASTYLSKTDAASTYDTIASVNNKIANSPSGGGGGDDECNVEHRSIRAFSQNIAGIGDHRLNKSC